MARAVAFFVIDDGRAVSDAGRPEACSARERQALFALAREAVCAAVEGRRPPALPRDLPSRLGEPAGAFVSLHQGADLRGCIGCVRSDTPLAALVVRIAAAAATDDRRFPALRPSELGGLHLEVSILSPLSAVAAHALEPSTHGVCLRLGDHGAVLLPQVAARHGWDRATLLARLCEKAGLSPAAWQDPAAVLLAFTVETVDGTL